MRNKRFLIALVLSSLLALLIGLLSNLAATYLAPTLANRAMWVYAALGVAFLVSLPLSYYLLTRTVSPVGQPAGPTIRQRTRNEGRIKGSPISVPSESAARIEVSAENGGQIEDSGVTIDRPERPDGSSARP